MIRLRQSLLAGLRHPLLGPVLLLGLGLVLAFVAFHAVVEHGVAGVASLLVSCALAAAAGLRLAIVLGRSCRVTPAWRRPARRGPPAALVRPLQRAVHPAAALALPLRR